MLSPAILHPIAFAVGIGLLCALALRKLRERFVDHPSDGVRA